MGIPAGMQYSVNPMASLHYNARQGHIIIVISSPLLDAAVLANRGFTETFPLLNCSSILGSY